MTEYHWILTLQKQHPRGGVVVTTGSGCLQAGPDSSREGIFNAVLESCRVDLSTMNILFFSLEPNQRGGGAR